MKHSLFLIATGGLLILALHQVNVSAQTTTLPEMPNDMIMEAGNDSRFNITNSGSNTTTTTSPFSVTPSEMPEFMPFMDQQPMQEPNTSSIELFPLIMESIRTEINTTLNEAIDTAINSVNAEGNNSTNIIPIYSAIETERGAIVYRVFVVDHANMVQMVTIDPGNGQVLSVDIVPNEVAISMIMASSGGLGGGGGFGPTLGPGIMLG